MVDVPAPDLEPSTRVVAVYPTGPEVPENRLRLYVVFSTPMGLGGQCARCSTTPGASSVPRLPHDGQKLQGCRPIRNRTRHELRRSAFHHALYAANDNVLTRRFQDEVPPGS